MSDKLSHIEGTSVDELKQISVSMQQYIRTENEAALQTALDKINQKPGLLRRLFPTAYEKEQQRITVQRMRSMAKAKEDLFKLYTDVQLEIARKQGDALIASVGMDLQTKLTAFAAERIDEITDTINESRLRFLKRIRPQYEEIENYKDIPDLHMRALESVKQEVGIYFDSIGKLLTGFIDALDSKVQSSRK
jgi:hypothetical protein